MPVSRARVIGPATLSRTRSLAMTTRPRGAALVFLPPEKAVGRVGEFHDVKCAGEGAALAKSPHSYTPPHHALRARAGGEMESRSHGVHRHCEERKRRSNPA